MHFHNHALENVEGISAVEKEVEGTGKLKDMET
jgi:hypothetical protein